MRAIRDKVMTRWALLFWLLASFSGCELAADHKAIIGAEPGNITFLWNLAGQSCSQVPVSKVAISMLSSDGTPQSLGSLYGLQGYGPGEFPCSNSGTDGITLTNFTPDTYSYTINAYDMNHVLLYTGSGTVTVNGDQVLVVPLASVPSGSVVLAWTFQGQSCDQAKVTGVVMTLNGGTPTTVPCTSTVGDGVVLTKVAANTPYQVQLQSVDNLGPNDGLSHFYQLVSVIVTDTSPSQYSIDLKWAGTGLVLGWTIGGSTDCTAVGVGSLNMILADNGIYANADGAKGVCIPCSPSQVDFPYLWTGDQWTADAAGVYHYESQYTLNLVAFASSDCSGNPTDHAVSSKTITVRGDVQPQNTVVVDLP